MTVQEAQQLLNMRGTPKSAKAITDAYAKRAYALQALLPHTVGKAKKTALDQQITQLSEARDVLMRLVPPPPKPSAPTRPTAKALAPATRNKQTHNAPTTPGPLIDPAIVQALQAIVGWIAQIPKTARRVYVHTVAAYRVTSSIVYDLWRRGTAFTQITWSTASYIAIRVSIATVTTYKIVSSVVRRLWRLSTGCVRIVWRVSNYIVVRAGLIMIVAVATLYALWLIVESYPRTAHVSEVAVSEPSSLPATMEAKPTRTLPIDPSPTNDNSDAVLGATLSIPSPAEPSASKLDEPQYTAPLTPTGTVEDQSNGRSPLDISDLDFDVPVETPAVPTTEPVNVDETITFDPEEMYLLFHGSDGDRALDGVVPVDENDEVTLNGSGADAEREAQMWEVLDRMDDQLTAELIDAELATRDEQPTKCFARFLAWPPCEVYCGERQVTQAPDPMSYEFLSGEHRFRFVHEEELVFEQTLAFQPGAHHIVEVNLLAGTVHVKEE